MNISVTGGTGCLGTALVERLLLENIKPKLLVFPDASHPSLPLDVFETVVGDLNNINSMEELCKGAETVFHLAGKAHFIPRNKDEEDAFFRINVDGTRTLLKAAKNNGVKRVVFYSTVGVYGKDSNFHGDENSQCNPTNAYSKSKYDAEQLLLNSEKEGGPEGVVLRFPVVYGPFDRGNVAKLINSIRKRLFFFFGKGDSIRSMISSKNAAEAAFLSAFSPNAANDVFCMTDENDYSLNEIVKVICNELEITSHPAHIPIGIATLAGQVGDIFNNWAGINLPIDSDRVRKLSSSLTFSSNKAVKVLGYKPVETLREGIRREIEWLYP